MLLQTEEPTADLPVQRLTVDVVVGPREVITVDTFPVLIQYFRRTPPKYNTRRRKYGRYSAISLAMQTKKQNKKD